MPTHHTTRQNHPAVRTGSAVPAYFLGRRRETYIAALARTPQDSQFARAA